MFEIMIGQLIRLEEKSSLLLLAKTHLYKHIPSDIYCSNLFHNLHVNANI